MMISRARERNGVDAVTYWTVIALALAGGVSIWAWKQLSDAQRSSVIPIGAGRNDVKIGGPWTMLDITGRPGIPSRGARLGLKRGDVITVLLSAGAPLPLPYVVWVIGPSGSADLPFTGIWALAVPPAGPQAIDFGPEHVFTIA